jgi:TonB family protein
MIDVTVRSRLCFSMPKAILFFGIAFSLSAFAGSFTPPQNLNPDSATIRLNSSYTDEAWLVYTYDIGADGLIANARIQSSNGVPRVERAVLERVQMMRFKPALSNGVPVLVSADPITFTWILDQARDMSPSFADIYQTAWAYVKQKDYDAAFDQAARLKAFPARNAYEEVKFQVLAASLANRWEDEAAELQHLGRAVELQSLADANNFQNAYIEQGQYLQILSRIQTLQLNRMMLADAAETLQKIQRLDAGSEIASGAAASFATAEQEFNSRADVTISAELTPIYRDGPGIWKTGLSRDTFSISNVKGSVEAIFLICDRGEKQIAYPSIDPWTVPAGWQRCKVDVSGRAGTRFMLHQLTSG